jgi:hypothetical protein
VAVYAGTTARVSRRLGRSRRPVVTAASMTAVGAVATVYQSASALTRHYWPLAAVAAVVSPRARRALAAAAVVDGLLDYRRTRPDLDPVRYIAARRLDDLAYGAGLWYGAWRALGARAAAVLAGDRRPTYELTPDLVTHEVLRFAPILRGDPDFRNST